MTKYLIPLKFKGVQKQPKGLGYEIGSEVTRLTVRMKHVMFSVPDYDLRRLKWVCIEIIERSMLAGQNIQFLTNGLEDRVIKLRRYKYYSIITLLLLNLELQSEGMLPTI